ncbi:hypothetical protein JCM16303_006159 [Sporobolomyces ruberrimus]
MTALRRPLTSSYRPLSPGPRNVRAHILFLRPSPSSFRFSSSSSTSPSDNLPPIFQAKNTDVYPFGVPSNDPSRALFLKLSWTITSSSSWAILSSSSSSQTRSHLLSTILHQVRYEPTHSASHPLLKTLPPIERPLEEGGVSREPTVEDLIQVVSFKTRLGPSSEFDDYTARYYSIRDEDKLSTFDHLKQSAQTDPDHKTPQEVEEEILKMSRELEMEELLDLPLITLSNGQTRRARILKALIKKPQLLILEEPFTGLDISSRELLVRLLTSLHSTRSPRILLILRPQDELPPFVSHLALVDSSSDSHSQGGRVKFGPKSEILETKEAKEMTRRGEEDRRRLAERKLKQKEKLRNVEESGKEGREGAARGEKLIELRGVNVVYGRKGETKERQVLQDVDWTIREGEKWVLAGHNGSGKSTLLSIILGDHPRSFTEDVTLFDKPRYRQATSTIQQSIGHVSPEIFNAFPRKHGDQGLTAYDAIVTGFESIYSYRSPTPSQHTAITSLISTFNHPLLTPDFLSRLFASLTPGEQSLILLLRALVKNPRLLILDEPFQGMDQETIRIVKRYLEQDRDASEGGKQSVVLISHFEEEVPEGFERRLELENGRIKELI